MGVFDRFYTWLGRFAEAPSTGGGKSLKRDPIQGVLRKIGLALNFEAREFVPPEFDLTQITNAINTESYIRQAVDKYIEMMFKSGWDIIGKNPNTVEYVRLRLSMMAEVTQIPTDQLFIEMAEDLVKYGNAVVVKARVDDVNSLPPGVKVQGIGGNQPIGGYFPVNVTTLSVRRDKFGTVKGWQQEVDGQEKAIKFKPEDVIHIYYKREKGNAFGTPFLLPVLDDIRALRQAEENVLKIIYRNLFPYIHVKVGLPEEGLGASDAEIAKVKTEIENLDLEAGAVTSERISILPVATNQVINAQPYLKYFEQRVFTGLGVSELMMGRGDTANRSTGDNLSSEFADRVKAFQRVMEIFVNDFILKELLMEFGVDPVLNPVDSVHFRFKEINVDAKIKAENHAIFQYEHNAISEDEMRLMLGRDPITDRAKMFMNTVSIPVALQTKGQTSTNTNDTENRTQPRNQSTPRPGNTQSPSRQAANAEPYLNKIEEEYIDLNKSINELIDKYFKEKYNITNELSDIILYSENKIKELTKDYLSLNQLTLIDKSISYQMINLKNTILNLLEEDSKLLDTQESVNAIFEVFYDKFEQISSEAYMNYLEEGE